MINVFPVSHRQVTPVDVPDRLSVCGVDEASVQRRALLSCVGSTLSATVAGCVTGRDRELAEDPLERTIDHGGRERRYRLVLPDGGGPWPVVLVLHGGGGTPERVAGNTGFDGAAIAEGFAAVYPAGLDGWNDGRTGQATASRGDVDDVGFLRALADRLVEREIARPDGLYWTGISNGAMMILRLCLEATEVVGGAATVAGSFPAALDGVPSPAVPMLLHHGTADPLVPYEGGGVGFATESGRRGRVRSAAETVERFLEANGCRSDPVVTTHDDVRDGTRLETRRYEGCAAPVVHHVVHRGGHRWPGGPSSVLDLLLGARTREFDATRAALEFFRRRCADDEYG